MWSDILQIVTLWLFLSGDHHQATWSQAMKNKVLRETWPDPEEPDEWGGVEGPAMPMQTIFWVKKWSKMGCSYVGDVREFVYANHGHFKKWDVPVMDLNGK